MEVEIVDSIEALLSKVDVVLLETTMAGVIWSKPSRFESRKNPVYRQPLPPTVGCPCHLQGSKTSGSRSFQLRRFAI